MDFKKLGKKILFPPLWVTFSLAAASAAALIYVFVKSLESSPLAYAVYVLSFYSLCTVSAYFVLVFPKSCRKIKTAVYRNKYGNRYMTDVAFKTQVSLYRSLGVNLLYAAVNILSYFLYHSAWFVILAVYYTILAVMRFLLLRYSGRNTLGKNRIGELKRSVLCSYIMLTLNFALSGAVMMILYMDKGFEYHGVMIYVMAAYTFYITTYAIINIVKYRKYRSPVIMTSKMISLSAALVSMLSLETAMLSEFGTDMAPMTRRIFIASTGAGVAAAVITMSVFMIVRCTNEIRLEKKLQTSSRNYLSLKK